MERDYIQLTSFDEKMGFYINEFEEVDTLELITSYDVAKELLILYGCEEYEDYVGLDLQSDVREYSVTIIKDEVLIIEPLKNDNGYCGMEGEKIFVEKEFLTDKLEECLDFEEIIVVTDDEDTEEERECRDCCENCAASCCYNDTNDEGLGEEIEEFLTEVIKDYYNDEIDLRTLARIIYQIAYTDGENSTLLNLRESIDKALED